MIVIVFVFSAILWCLPIKLGLPAGPMPRALVVRDPAARSCSLTCDTRLRICSAARTRERACTADKCQAEIKKCVRDTPEPARVSDGMSYPPEASDLPEELQELAYPGEPPPAPVSYPKIDQAAGAHKLRKMKAAVPPCLKHVDEPWQSRFRLPVAHPLTTLTPYM